MSMRMRASARRPVSPSLLGFHPTTYIKRMFVGGPPAGFDRVYGATKQLACARLVV